MKERLKAWGRARVIPAASVMVFNKSGRLLLLQRHSEDLGGGMWGTPSGRVEDGESERDTALRELREETSIVADELLLLGRHRVDMPHGSIHLTTFRAQVDDSVSIVLDPDEHHDHRWHALEDILTTPNIIWGMPTTLRDFGLVGDFGEDPTLSDGSRVTFFGTM